MDVTIAIQTGKQFVEAQGVVAPELETLRGQCTLDRNEFPADSTERIDEPRFFWMMTFVSAEHKKRGTDIVFVIVDNDSGTARFAKNTEQFLRVPTFPKFDFSKSHLSKEDAVLRAIDFARVEGIEVGKVFNILYDPITRLDDLWHPSLSTSVDDRYKWCILLEIPKSTMDPGTLKVGIDDITGQAVFLDNL